MSSIAAIGEKQIHRERSERWTMRARASSRPCPWCGSTAVHRQRSRHMYERFVVPVTFRWPYKCSRCRLPFKAFHFSMRLLVRAVLSTAAMAFLFSAGLVMINWLLEKF
jgi:hypothetical protein